MRSVSWRWVIPRMPAHADQPERQQHQQRERVHCFQSPSNTLLLHNRIYRRADAPSRQSDPERLQRRALVFSPDPAPQSFHGSIQSLGAMHTMNGRNSASTRIVSPWAANTSGSCL